jgi:hypothetical protein
VTTLRDLMIDFGEPTVYWPLDDEGPAELWEDPDDGFLYGLARDGYADEATSTLANAFGDPGFLTEPEHNESWTDAGAIAVGDLLPSYTLPTDVNRRFTWEVTLGTASSSGDVEVDLWVDGAVIDTATLGVGVTSYTNVTPFQTVGGDVVYPEITAVGTGAADMTVTLTGDVGTVGYYHNTDSDPGAGGASTPIDFQAGARGV